MIFAHNLHFFNFAFKIIWSIVLTWPLKLNILSNHTEHLKGLAPFVIHTIPFYNSKIFILNESASLLGEKWLQLEDKNALHKEAKPSSLPLISLTMETTKTF